MSSPRSAFVVAAAFSVAASLLAWGTLQLRSVVELDTAHAAFVLFLGVLGIGVIVTSLRFARSGIKTGFACGMGAAAGLTLAMLAYWLTGDFGGDFPMPWAGLFAVVVLAGPYLAWMLVLTGALEVLRRTRQQLPGNSERDEPPRRRSVIP